VVGDGGDPGAATRDTVLFHSLHFNITLPSLIRPCSSQIQTREHADSGCVVGKEAIFPVFSQTPFRPPQRTQGQRFSDTEFHRSEHQRDPSDAHCYGRQSCQGSSGELQIHSLWPVSSRRLIVQLHNRQQRKKEGKTILKLCSCQRSERHSSFERPDIPSPGACSDPQDIGQHDRRFIWG